MVTRIQRDSIGKLCPDSLLDRHTAVELVVARCTPPADGYQRLRDRVRKLICYAIQTKKLHLRKNGMVRLGDVASVLSQNRHAARYGANLRDISDAIPRNGASVNTPLAPLVGSGVSFPADRAGVVAIALKSIERIEVLERQLTCCLAAAERRATIAEQKGDRERLRRTLDDPVSNGPSFADLNAVFARPAKKKVSTLK